MKMAHSKQKNREEFSHLPCLPARIRKAVRRRVIGSLHTKKKQIRSCQEKTSQRRSNEGTDYCYRETKEKGRTPRKGGNPAAPAACLPLIDPAFPSTGLISSLGHGWTRGGGARRRVAGGLAQGRRHGRDGVAGGGGEVPGVLAPRGGQVRAQGSRWG